MNFLGFRAVAAGVLLGVWGSIAGADAPDVAADAMCPDTVSGLGSALGTVIGCRCPAEVSGSVWGSGPYTSDSNFCAAARHAGVADDGAIVWGVISPGLDAYEGSKRNGVSTGSYGKYRGSLSFPAQGQTPAITAATVPAAGELQLCPGDMRGSAAPLKCHCPESMLTSGSVWGTDIYTEDSAMCRAALHAGVITTEGGNITAVPVAGQQKYLGSDRNGVTSQDYGSWGASYIVTP